MSLQQNHRLSGHSTQPPIMKQVVILHEFVADPTDEPLRLAQELLKTVILKEEQEKRRSSVPSFCEQPQTNCGGIEPQNGGNGRGRMSTSFLGQYLRTSKTLLRTKTWLMRLVVFLMWSSTLPLNFST